jgi:tetratricopeptide (TPR) repeat protein
MKQALLIALIVCGMLACGVNSQPTIPQSTSFDTSTFVTPTNTIAPSVGQSSNAAETPTPIVEAIIPTLVEINTVEIRTPTVAQAMEEVTTTPTELTYSCTDVDASWGNNWETVIAALEQLITNNQSCDNEPLSSKKYAAHFIYGMSLEKEGDIESAIAQYQAALLIAPQRTEALEGLIRLNALPEPTPAACQSASPPLSDPAPANPPDLSRFVTVEGDQLQLYGQLFKVRGVNYYPRHAPWHRFIEEVDISEVATELDLIKQAGFNTIRVFLRYEPLFTCQPEDAIPNEENFARVDKIIELARERDLKMIVTLNDLPDLTFRPLYSDWSHYDTQTVYIVRRYRNEPIILAWDLRNEGDLDYGVRPGDEPRFSQDEVMTWLAHVSELVRKNDPNHLLTAGWWGDPTITDSYVDILSFHHWSEADQLQARIADYQQRNYKPLMLQEVGYHSWAGAPHDQRDEIGQADILGRVTNLAETEDISGWIVWTAFDFVPKAGEAYNFEHFFGVWQADLTPKLALQALPLQ